MVAKFTAGTHRGTMYHSYHDMRHWFVSKYVTSNAVLFSVNMGKRPKRDGILDGVGVRTVDGLM